MKKLLFSGLLAVLSVGAFAQTSSGTVALGGAVNFSNASNEYGNSESKSSIFNLSPSIGYFVRDGLELGLDTRISFGSNTSNVYGSDNEVKNNNFGFAVGPYLKKYVSVTEKLHFTASGGFGYQRSRSKNPNANEELLSTTSGYYVSAAPGLTYFATPKLGFTISMGNIGFSRSTETDEQTEPKRETVYKSFNFNFSPATVSVGLGYYINR